MTTSAQTASPSTQPTGIDAFESTDAYNLVPGVDRCDRCGAEAFVATAHVNGVLLWCAHHAKEHSPALKNDDRVTVIANRTHVLAAKPTQ